MFTALVVWCPAVCSGGTSSWINGLWSRHGLWNSEWHENQRKQQTDERTNYIKIPVGLVKHKVGKTVKTQQSVHKQMAFGL